MILSEEDIRELTRRIQRAAQQRVLTFMGIEHRTRPDGSLVVLRDHVDCLLSGIAAIKARSTKEPNWDVFATAT